MLDNIGRLTCDSHHNFVDLFSISEYVCKSDFDSRKKNLDNAPTSSDDVIQGVSPLPSCKFYTPAHDHGVHDFFNKSSI